MLFQSANDRYMDTVSCSVLCMLSVTRKGRERVTDQKKRKGRERVSFSAQSWLFL